jgi:hypothetical protein
MAALEALRPDGTWRTSQDVTVTWAGRTTSVRVDSVRTDITAGYGGLVIMSGQCIERTAPSMVDIALEGRSPEDLTELAVRIALFGENNPLGPMSFMVKLENPFDVIDSLGLPEDAVEPVARLFLTELLVGGARADRITRLAVGPAHLGVRRVALEWAPRRRYSNVLPDLRIAEGDVRVRTINVPGRTV